MNFRKGDRIVTVLRGAGVEIREDGVIAYVRKGIAYVDNGPGNDLTGYDNKTGRYALGDDLFQRWIEPADTGELGDVLFKRHRDRGISISSWHRSRRDLAEQLSLLA